MRLIFKIFKKVRELERKERELSEKITSLLIEKTQIETHVEQLQYERCNEAIYKNERETRLDQREEELDKREQELNELQQKINDQILKLGIVQGVNK